LPDKKKLITNSNSVQKNAFRFTYFSLCDKKTQMTLLSCVYKLGISKFIPLTSIIQHK